MITKYHVSTIDKKKTTSCQIKGWFGFILFTSLNYNTNLHNFEFHFSSQGWLNSSFHKWLSNRNSISLKPPQKIILYIIELCWSLNNSNGHIFLNCLQWKPQSWWKIKVFLWEAAFYMQVWSLFPRCSQIRGNSFYGAKINFSALFGKGKEGCQKSRKIKLWGDWESLSNIGTQERSLDFYVIIYNIWCSSYLPVNQISH